MFATLINLNDITSQGLSLGMVAILLAMTFFLLYIPIYAVVIRPRRRTDKKEVKEKMPEEKTIKPNMPEYNGCTLNEIMGYDFIQTQYIKDPNASQPDSATNDGQKPSSENIGIGMPDGGINESYIGVTGRESSDPQDEPTPTETKEDKKKCLAEMKAQAELEKRLKEREADKDEEKERGEAINIEGDLATLYNTEWPEDDLDDNENNLDWAEPYDDSRFGENTDEDASEMEDLAGVPKDPQSYEEMERLMFAKELDNLNGGEISESQQRFLTGYKDDYVEQPHNKAD